ncbi:MAG: hypothetical protein V4702_02315 [Patescibacteria group bacterium]
MQSRTKTRVITNSVIKGLVAAGAIATAVVAPNSVQLIDKYLQKRDKKSAQKTLYYLKYRKLITVKKVGDLNHYKLTSKGFDKYQKILLDELVIKIPRNWDEKWRLVMFDIPAGHDKQRKELLHKLKDLNFYMLQKSAWIHPFDCEKQIGILLNILELEQYTSYIEVQKGNFTEHAAVYFHKQGLLM